jgi:hypothetical protein
VKCIRQHCKRNIVDTFTHSYCCICHIATYRYKTLLCRLLIHIVSLTQVQHLSLHVVLANYIPNPHNKVGCCWGCSAAAYATCSGNRLTVFFYFTFPRPLIIVQPCLRTILFGTRYSTCTQASQAFIHSALALIPSSPSI